MGTSGNIPQISTITRKCQKVQKLPQESRQSSWTKKVIHTLIMWTLKKYQTYDATKALMKTGKWRWTIGVPHFFRTIVQILIHLNQRMFLKPHTYSLHRPVKTLEIFLK